MLNSLNKKCSVCKMKLEDGKKYPEEFGKGFCSENCREEYRRKMKKEQLRKSGDCCH